MMKGSGGRNYSFMQNRDCEYFPCHAGVSEEDFNCLFCYCPLYALGKPAAETAVIFLPA